MDKNEENIKEENGKNETKKIKKVKKFKITYIKFLIIILIITIVAILFTIKFLNSQYKVDDSVISNLNSSSNDKTLETDLKYGINSLEETYSTNAIKQITYYDVDGVTYQDTIDWNIRENAKNVISYIQISGLKDKDIESKVNQRIRNLAYEYKDYSSVSMYTVSNFANIMSLTLSAYTNDEEANINKTTGTTLTLNLIDGEDVKFEDLFVKSTPIKTLIADGIYDTLCWNSKNKSDANSTDPDAWFDDFDMNKQDTTEYEEKITALANLYDSQKDNIKFYVTPSKVVLNDFLPEEEFKNYTRSVSIDMTKFYNYYAVYKRFTTSKDLYEDDSLAVKNIPILITFTDNYWNNYEYQRNSSYICEIATYFPEKDDANYSNINWYIAEDYMNNLISNLKSQGIQNLSSDKGMVIQGTYSISYVTQYDCFCVGEDYVITTCSLDYYKNDLMKDFIKMKNYPTASAELLMFSTSRKDDFPNLSIGQGVSNRYYISKTGELLGKSWDDLKNKIYE